MVDVTGTPPRPADVAVDGERIAEVCDDVGARRRELDAEDRAVRPRLA